MARRDPRFVGAGRSGRGGGEGGGPGPPRGSSKPGPGAQSGAAPAPRAPAAWVQRFPVGTPSQGRGAAGRGDPGSGSAAGLAAGSTPRGPARRPEQIPGRPGVPVVPEARAGSPCAGRGLGAGCPGARGRRGGSRAGRGGASRVEAGRGAGGAVGLAGALRVRDARAGLLPRPRSVPRGTRSTFGHSACARGVQVAGPRRRPPEPCVRRLRVRCCGETPRPRARKFWAWVSRCLPSAGTPSARPGAEGGADGRAPAGWGGPDSRIAPSPPAVPLPPHEPAARPENPASGRRRRLPALLRARAAVVPPPRDRRPP